MRDGPILAFCRQDGIPAMTCQIRPKIVVCYILCPSDRFADPMQWFVVAATADADAFDIEARKNNS